MNKYLQHPGTRALIIMVGLPRAGKTTWANAQPHPKVSRDSIRLAVHGQRFIQEAEELISFMEEKMVKALFISGAKTVIVDGTHVTYARRERWYSMFEDWDVNVTTKIIDTSKWECLRRAGDGGREDLLPVISRMADECDVPEINNSFYIRDKKGTSAT
jgi:predicted kinase